MNIMYIETKCFFFVLNKAAPLCIGFNSEKTTYGMESVYDLVLDKLVASPDSPSHAV